MAASKKFKLIFKDRIGIVFDITKLMFEQELNIICMEVEQKDGFAQISIEIENKHNNINTKKLLDLFATLPNIESQSELKRLPQEKRARWFRTLFDGISEGIISVDSKGIVNTANNVACRILDLSYENIVNTHVSELSPKDNILLECAEKNSRQQEKISSNQHRQS